MTQTRRALIANLEALSEDARAMIRDVEYSKPPAYLQTDAEAIQEAWQRVERMCSQLFEEEGEETT